MRNALLAAAALWLVVPFAHGETGVVHLRRTDSHWQIWSTDLQGQSARPLTTTPWDKRCLRFEPKRGQLLFRDNQGSLLSLHMNDDTGSVAAILPQAEVVKDFDFNAEYGFLISTYAPNAKDNIRIWWYSEDGKEKRVLVSDPHLNVMPRWVAGGKSCIFVKQHAGKSHLWRVDLPDAAVSTLLGESSASTTDPAPSPDGRLLAFCQEGKGGWDLWLAKIDGADRRALYAGPGMETEPCWSPDGEQIYLSVWDGKTFRIARILPDGTGFVFVTPEGVDCRCPVVVGSSR